MSFMMSRSNFKWPFSMSHNRLQTGGWARQQNGWSLAGVLEMILLTWLPKSIICPSQKLLQVRQIVQTLATR